MNIEEFNDELVLIESDTDRTKFVQKYIFHGTPEVFLQREVEYFEFRNKIAEFFKVGFYEVFIVGSAKLGFSYFKNKKFDYDSDIDVVVVNESLFELYFNKISEYQYQLDKQHQVVSQYEKQQYQEFLRYLVKGWMRPDKLPTSFQVSLLKDGWFDFFKSISYGNSEVGNYKVAAGLFKNYKYLETYYLNGITDYQRQLIIN